MATSIAALIVIIRRHLNEPSPETATSFWTDDEIAALIDKGARDLKRAIDDNYQNYFLTVDVTNVSQASGASQLSGVPADCGIVRGIEPVDPVARPGLIYVPKDYNSVEFARARTVGSQDPSQAGTVFYAITDAGAPVAAPVIRVAPVLSATIAVRLSYVPALAVITKNTAANPIPGESDNALIAWGTAYAMSKGSAEQEPHSGWLSLYKTEKENILVALAPRQTDEPDVAEAMFEDEWS